MLKLQKSKIAIAAGLVCLLVSVDPASGKDDKKSASPADKIKTDWKFSKNIECSSDVNTYKFFLLDEDVYRYALSGLADLRIIDSNGDQTPYFIEHGSTEYASREIKYKSRKIGENINWNKKKASFDFQIIPGQGSFVGRTIILTVPQENYSRQVIVYGRYDNTDWQEIKTDSIYKFEKYFKNNIDFDTELSYNFYRIQIIDAVPGNSISGLMLAGSTLTRFEQLYQKKDLDYTVKNEESSTLLAIKNPGRLKIFHLLFKIDGTFNRDFELYSETEYELSDARQRSREKRKHPISDGKIYNFEFKETSISNRSIDLAHNHRNSEIIYMRIFNNNDKPLDIKGIQSSYYIDKVVFKSAKGMSYKIYFGNQKAEHPVYDIVTYKKHIYKEKMDNCKAGNINGKIPEADQLPLISEKKLKIILNVIIVIISLLLIFFIVKKLKKN